MTIKIEIPSTSEHKELARLIGEALTQYGTVTVEQTVTVEDPSTIEIIKSGAVNVSTGYKVHLPGEVHQVEINGTLSDDDTEQRPDLAQLAADGAQAPEGVELDSDGLPHDTRIHSQPAKTNADGTWKARRIPKDMDKDEWEVYQEEVKAELRQALSGEPITSNGPYYWVHDESGSCGIVDTVEELEQMLQEPLVSSVSKEIYDQRVKSGYDYGQADDVTPPPPATDDVTPPPPPAATEDVTPPPAATEDVTPPPAVVEDVTPPPAVVEDVTPPPAVVEDVTPPPAANDRTFAELMKLITSNKEALGGTDSIANVTKVLNNHGVKALPLLNSTRPDLIPVVYAELEGMING